MSLFKQCISILPLLALLVGQANAQEVIPDFYRDPGLNPNRSYVNQSFNEHIDPFTGALQLHYVDLHIPGNGGFDLKVVRSYNSASVDPLNPATYESLAGLGWTVHFGRVLKTRQSSVCVNENAFLIGDNPVLELPDGSRQMLAFTGGTAPLMLTTQRWRVDCSGSSGVVVYSPDGVRYDMTQLVNVGTGVNPVYAWYTKKITDRNGNYANINYAGSASPEITSVSTSDNRSIAFTYADSGLTSRRITSISGAGQTYNYSYTPISGVTGEYLLSTVTRPGGTTWNYNYNANIDPAAGSYVISRVTYPQGGYINYGYEFVYFDSQANPSSRATVVASKSVSTGGSWSFDYEPGAPGAYDKTTVNTPSGTITYRHIGPNYSGPGTVWMVGLLVSKTIGSVQSESYTWGKQKISSENYYRPGAFVTKVDSGETNAPVLTQKSITRNGATYTTNYSGFDAYGNPDTVAENGTHGGARTTTLTYYRDTTKWIVKQVQNETFPGSSIARVFNSDGNMTSINRDGVVTSFTYDNDGNVASATMPRSLVHNYSSYERGIARTESQPQSISISRQVSTAGNVTSETNGEGRTTSYAYDGLNRVTSVTYPTGDGVTVVYGAASKSAKRGSSLEEKTLYDGFGRPTSITLGGIARTFDYDALGRKTFESDPGASTGTNYQYDLLNRVTRVTHSADGSYRAISYGAGTKTVTDERSNSTTYSYRAYGDPDQQVLMGITAPVSSASVSISRNSKGLVTSVTQAGLTRSYGYNSNYYLTSVINPETGTTTYGRDAAGNMTSRTVGASGTTSYGYDGQNRLVSTTYPGSGSISQTYSKTHKLKTVTSTAASRSYGYDANDNLTSESVTAGGVTLAATYAYNSRDQLSSITYPRSNSVVSYSPDPLGRPTLVSGYASSVTYWPSGQIKAITYNNGTVTNYGQNSRLWPSSFSTQKSGTYYANSSYGYDDAGNLTSISDATDSSYNRTLGYDAIDRLTGASGPWGSGTIAYSGAGNITSQVLGSYSLFYNYDGNNRLGSVSGNRATSYAYDAYGNIISGNASTYTYDGAPNLTCVNCANPSLKVAYTYDGLNKRVSVTKAGVTSYEFHDSHGNQLVEFTPSQANKLVEYIYLGGKRIAQKATP